MRKYIGLLRIECRCFVKVMLLWYGKDEILVEEPLDAWDHQHATISFSVMRVLGWSIKPRGTVDWISQTLNTVIKGIAYWLLILQNVQRATLLYKHLGFLNENLVLKNFCTFTNTLNYINVCSSLCGSYRGSHFVLVFIITEEPSLDIKQSSMTDSICP